MNPLAVALANALDIPLFYSMRDDRERLEIQEIARGLFFLHKEGEPLSALCLPRSAVRSSLIARIGSLLMWHIQSPWNSFLNDW